jgi:hypothetical protein
MYQLFNRDEKSVRFATFFTQKIKKRSKIMTPPTMHLPLSPTGGNQGGSFARNICSTPV